MTAQGTAPETLQQAELNLKEKAQDWRAWLQTLTGAPDAHHEEEEKSRLLLAKAALDWLRQVELGEKG